MKVEYSRRAVADLRKIAQESASFGEVVVSALEQRLRDMMATISAHPEAAPRLLDRPQIRVMPLVRYPYKIFYRVVGDGVRILHIRHTGRRPWSQYR
jgi:toxin ParE1/3/4